MAQRFAPLPSVPDHPALERDVLAWWDEHRVFEQLRERNRGGPIWSFVDGPITANNPMGVHHAWGRTYKDVYNRYFAMTGHELRYQQGFDCDGLWVEVSRRKDGVIEEMTRVVHLPAGLDEPTRQKLLEIANKCPVHKTLTGQIKILTSLG